MESQPAVNIDQQFNISSSSSRLIPPSNSLLIQTPPPAIISNNHLNFLSNSFDHHHHSVLLFPPQLPNYQNQTHLFQSNHFHDLPRSSDHDHQLMQYNHHHDQCKLLVVDQPHHHHIGTAIDMNHDHDSWSDDEVIQLLRIKSTSDNWFKDFTWEHVSRKLAETGYKRSAEKCKEKFEEETCRSFSSTSMGDYKSSSNNRYLISEELDEHLYDNSDHHHHICNTSTADHHHVTCTPENHHNDHQQAQEEEAQLVQEKKEGEQDLDQPQPTEDDDDAQALITKGRNKRKRNHNNKFKMVKGLCIDFVNQMMTQQEEMHKRLLEDMAKKEKEKIEKEEAWRKEEMERVKKDIDNREHEQEMARDRQSTITEFLNKITSLDQNIQVALLQGLQTDMVVPNKLPAAEITNDHQLQIAAAKDEIGKRWPRDEVLALINIRSNVNINGGNCELGSLWERISQGMLELGYKRSAKRCKEKWENINKYFRKTKDANKKRSLDSTTCPYYHELTKLYNQEKNLPSSSNSISQKSKITPQN